MTKKHTQTKAEPKPKAKVEPKERKPRAKKVAQKSPEGPSEFNSGPDLAGVRGDSPVLAVLKSKLLRKYNLLKPETLTQDNREDLLNFVCRVLGMSRKEIDWVVKDL